MQSSSVSLGMIVEEPSWIELNGSSDQENFGLHLDDYIKKNGEPSIVLIMLSFEKYYRFFKNVCYARNCISQCVTFKTAKRVNPSVASNVLRQINSKIGGDLYHLQFSKTLIPNTMLMGIDVCHSGPNSIVGFCASINKTMSQYYSQKIVQKRGQEIVDKQLKEAMKTALGCFSERHQTLPDHLILYRDGVGDAMRR